MQIQRPLVLATDKLMIFSGDTPWLHSLMALPQVMSTIDDNQKFHHTHLSEIEGIKIYMIFNNRLHLSKRQVKDSDNDENIFFTGYWSNSRSLSYKES